MSEENQPRASRRTLVVLACVFALACALRVPGLTRLLPHSPEPDPFLVLSVQDLRADPAIRLHTEFKERYPSLLPRLVAPWPHGLARADASEREHLEAAAEPYLQTRIAVLALALLAIPLVFALARRFACDRDASFAAFFVATSLLHVSFSTQARPHAATAGLVLLAVTLAIRWLERPSALRAIAAVVASTAAAATFQSGVFALSPLMIAFALGPGSRLRRLARALLGVGAAAALALPFYPFKPRIDAQGIHLAGKSGHEIPLSDLTGEGLVRAAQWLLEYDPVLLALPLVGLAAALVRWRAWARDRRVLVCAAHAVPYGLVLAIDRELYERFLLPLVPWLALLAGAGVGALLDLGRERPIARAGLVAIAVLVVALPLAVAARFTRVATRPDALEDAARWLRENADARADTILAQPALTLPLLSTPDAVAANSADFASQNQVWTRYQAAADAGAAPPKGFDLRLMPVRVARGDAAEARAAAVLELDARRPRYVVLERAAKALFFPGLSELHALVRERGELAWAADIAEPEHVRQMRIDYQDARDLARRLFEQPRLGPRIEIWRMRER